MDYIDKLLEQVKRHEGFSATPYKCTAGKWTIGYGFNLDSYGVTDTEGLVWTEGYAAYVLEQQLSELTPPAYSKTPLEEVFKSCYYDYGTDKTIEYFFCRVEAIRNMAFNLGTGGVLKFKKMITALEKKDFDLAAKEMLDSKWAKQVGNRATELSEQMRTGEWQF